MCDLKKKQVPKNTGSNTKWAMKNFTDWHADYNERNPDRKCPDSILLPTCTKEELSKWLPVFILETRNQNGKNYPPQSLYSIVTGILHRMKNENPEYPNFLDKKDPIFVPFQITLDNLFKQLRADGVGAEFVHTEGISQEDEEQLWSSGVLNVETPGGLLLCVFFIMASAFA